MNNGKICVSVCERTVADFIKSVESANGAADLIELRLDCLDKDELGAEDVDHVQSVLGKIIAAAGDTSITTFRPKSFGGSREISSLERENLWNLGFETHVADLEEDVVENSWHWLWSERICSFHDFDGVPSDIDSLFKRLAATKVDIVKIAIRADDAADAIPVWRLFELAESLGTRVIPIAMGEAGKWTRILGLAHGAPITYASPDKAGGTAPGQIRVSDLRDLFRVKDLNKDTAIVGIVAGNTSYSFSPYMHNAAFKTAGLNSVFVPLQVADLDTFMRRMVNRRTREVDLNFVGFSVTNPHKQNVINYLSRLDPTAKAIGAVNTVKIDGDEMIGYNTDAPGFIKPLRKAFGDLNGARVAVAGAGGAARACVYALKQEGAEVTVLARDANKAASLADEFGIRSEQLTTDHGPFANEILVNATPLGTKGERENDTIATADQLADVRLVYDLIYNPVETRLIREAKSAGVPTIGGLEMFFAQGAKQFEIWTGQEAPLEAMRAAIERRLK